MTTNNTKGNEMNTNKRNWFEVVCFAVLGACLLIGINAVVWGLVFGF